MTTTEHRAMTISAPCRFVPGMRPLAALWLRRARTRRHLRALEAHRLADIGLSEEARRRECAKWFWQK